ncbi:MAG: hypothetical protein SCH66_13085 [Methanolobus sp.]|nr:hypothetical protein [Methanolobus sp.]
MRILLIFLLIFLLIYLSIFTLPAAASYSWENDITVGLDDMSWTYTEQYSAEGSVLFRSFIDSELGDNDSFVAAWELLKMDRSSRKQLLDSLEDNMDVKINGSSDSIKPIRVESDLSAESMGPVSKDDSIVNIYEVQYAFDDPLFSQGDRIWFLGEPDTYVTITFPENARVVSTEGIDNVSIAQDGSFPQVSGEFGFTGEVVVYFEKDETLFIKAEGDDTVLVPPGESDERSFYSIVDEIFPGFTDEFLESLKGSSPM